MLLLALLACVPKATEEDEPTDSAGVDTADGDSGDLEADDARVRALTDLPEGDSPCAEPQLVRVDEFVDGDTFHALPEGDDWYFSVRIIGVDTPEIAHGGDEADCYGNEAWVYSNDALRGRLVWLTFDADCVDPYDRTLAYVIRGDGDDGFYNRVLARQGYAYEMTIEPNDSYADVIRDDIRDARSESLGLWGACDG